MLGERLTFHICKEKILPTELPKKIRVYERRGFEGLTGRIGIYKQAYFEVSDYTDCLAVIYKLVKVI